MIKKSLLDRHGNSLLIVKLLTLQFLCHLAFITNLLYSSRIRHAFKPAKPLCNQKTIYPRHARKPWLSQETICRRNRVSFPTHLDVDTPTISEPDVPRAQAPAYGNPDPRFVVSGEPLLPKVTTSSSSATQINTGSPLSSTYVPGAQEISPSHAHSNTICDPLFQQMQKESSDIQRKQVEILRTMAHPIPKPPIFSGNILNYPK